MEIGDFLMDVFVGKILVVKFFNKGSGGGAMGAVVLAN